MCTICIKKDYVKNTDILCITALMCIMHLNIIDGNTRNILEKIALTKLVIIAENNIPRNKH